MTDHQPPTYTPELTIALEAVHRASYLTRTVLASIPTDRSSSSPSSSSVSEIQKPDATPVTIADFAAQAILTSLLRYHFPHDGFVGEENASALREDGALAGKVWDLVERVRGRVAAATVDAGATPADAAATADATTADAATANAESTSINRNEWPASLPEMLDLIDLGGAGQGGREGRFWVMDPVDGTATFLTRQQYVVALSLIERGKEVVGVLGCPNLKPGAEGERVSEESTDEEGAGVVLWGVKGWGAYVAKMVPLDKKKEEGHNRTPKDTTKDTNPIASPPPLPSSPFSLLLSSRRLSLHTSSPPPPLSTLNFINSAATSLSLPLHHQIASSLGSPGSHNSPESFPATRTTIWSQQMKYVLLALGKTDVMLRIPRDRSRWTAIWDHSGGHLIFEESGGCVTDLDGGEIDFGVGRKLVGNFGMVAAAAGSSGSGGGRGVQRIVLERARELVGLAGKGE